VAINIDLENPDWMGKIRADSLAELEEKVEKQQATSAIDKDLHITFLGEDPTNSTLLLQHVGYNIIVDCNKFFKDQIANTGVASIDVVILTKSDDGTISGLSELSDWAKDKQESIAVWAEIDISGKIKNPFVEISTFELDKEFKVFGLSIIPFKIEETSTIGLRVADALVYALGAVEHYDTMDNVDTVIL